MSKTPFTTFRAGVRVLAAMAVLTAFGASAQTTWSRTTKYNPQRVEYSDATGKLIATFTYGARTVTVAGPQRTFTEASFKLGTFASSTWVRVLQKPFNGVTDKTEQQLKQWLNDTSPDVIEIAMQYVQGAPDKLNGAQRIAGQAGYGPLVNPNDPNSTARKEGADFNDYLGVAWAYSANQVSAADAEFAGDVDCSGFMRLVWGYRAGMPMSIYPDVANRSTLPRHSYEMVDYAPGVTLIDANSGNPQSQLSVLLPGDLVFFYSASQPSRPIGHVGMYIGNDANGDMRFVSSRQTINGPTFGTDYANQGGKSILNGTGYYAGYFRAARRL